MQDEDCCKSWLSWAELENALFYTTIDGQNVEIYECALPLREFDFSVVVQEGLRLYVR